MGRVHYHLHEVASGEFASANTPEVRGRILVVVPADNCFAVLRNQFPSCTIINTTSDRAPRQFAVAPPNLVLLGHSKDRPCLGLLRFFKSSHPATPIIIVSAQASPELIIATFRFGAKDFMVLPVDPCDLELSVRAALALGALSHGPHPTDDSPLARGLQYLEAHARDRIPLKVAARAAGMSVSTFNRHLKALSDTTFVSWRNNLRVEQAKKKLCGGRENMLSIALGSGFSGQPQFNRVFKKIVGMTPKEFQRRSLQPSP